MQAAEQQVIVDLWGMCALSLIVASLIYGYQRWNSPELGANRRGNVGTGSYDGLDMLMVLTLVGLFWANAILMAGHLAQGGEAREGGLDELGGELLGLEEEKGELSRLLPGLVMQLLLLGLVSLYLVVRGRSFGELFGLWSVGWRGVLLWSAGGLLVGWPVVMGVSAGIVELVKGTWLESGAMQESVRMFGALEGMGARLLFVTMAVLVAPVVEEVVFRGFFYGVVKRHSDRLFAVLWSGLTFGVVHGHLVSLLPLAIFGVVLALAYERTGSLWVPIIMHILFNAITVGMMVFMFDGELGLACESLWWWGSAWGR